MNERTARFVMSTGIEYMRAFLRRYGQWGVVRYVACIYICKHIRRWEAEQHQQQLFSHSQQRNLRDDASGSLALSQPRPRSRLREGLIGSYGRGRGRSRVGRVGVDVWMFGCLDVWMFGCMYRCLAAAWNHIGESDRQGVHHPADRGLASEDFVYGAGT
jgi:hypothetical protein